MKTADGVCPNCIEDLGYEVKSPGGWSKCICPYCHKKFWIKHLSTPSTDVLITNEKFLEFYKLDEKTNQVSVKNKPPERLYTDYLRPLFEKSKENKEINILKDQLTAESFAKKIVVFNDEHRAQIEKLHARFFERCLTYEQWLVQQGIEKRQEKRHHLKLV